MMLHKSSVELLAACLASAGFVLVFIDWLVKEKIKNRHDEILFDFLVKIESSNTNTVVRNSLIRARKFFDYSLGDKKISYRSNFTIFFLFTTLSIGAVFLGRYLQVSDVETTVKNFMNIKALQVFVVAQVIINSVLACISVIVTRYFLEVFSRGESVTSKIKYILLDTLAAYALIAVGVFAISVGYMPLLLFDENGDLGSALEMIEMLWLNRATTALEWPLSSSSAIDSISTNFYASISLLPTLTVVSITLSSLFVYFLSKLLLLFGYRITHDAVFGEKTIIGLMGGFMLFTFTIAFVIGRAFWTTE